MSPETVARTAVSGYTIRGGGAAGFIVAVDHRAAAA
jgi:hypothetical protein